jgi:hypothetical protein
VYGKVLGALMKMSLLILLFILLVDMYTRSLERPGFKLGYVFRFIWFVWATSFMYHIGGSVTTDTDGYREFNHNVFREYMK